MFNDALDTINNTCNSIRYPIINCNTKIASFIFIDIDVLLYLRMFLWTTNRGGKI